VVSPLIPLLVRTNSELKMKSIDAKYFNVGPRLTLTFVLLVALILGGNGLLIWQFRIARLHADRLSGVSQQMISVQRFQGSLLSFHQRLGELAQSRNAYVLRTESESLQSTLLEQIQQTRGALTRLPSGTQVDPLFLPTLEAIEISLPTQLDTITALASSGDWEAVHFRVADRLKPVETQASALVKIVDQEFVRELSRSEANMRSVQGRILVLVPAMAISTFSIAMFFAWAIARKILELRLEERVNERTRISRELHDTFLQTIQGSKLVADDALDPSTDPVRMRRAMEQLSVWLARATQEGRAALNSLRTTTTQTNDLAEALRRVTEESLIPSSMAVTFSIVGDAKEMHPIVRDEIYRIGYEAIRNACMHSRGGRLEVELRYANDLALRVSDNGTGIDLAIANGGKDGHFGLEGMRERAGRIGGKLTVVSSSSSGTEIKLVVPGGIVFGKTTPVRRSFLTKITSIFGSKHTPNLH
jgi:signal transduction histidine kinase